MSIVLWKNGEETDVIPFYRPLGLFNVWDTLAEEIWDTWMPIAFEDNMVPQTDMYEEKGELVMKTELPGIGEKDVDITLEGDILTIKAEKREEVTEDATHHTRERYYGQYFRSVMLPYAVKEDKITATLDNGVLELRLPKAEEVKSKKIELKAQPPKDGTKTPKQKPRQKKS